ncbi:DUF72 domain-containing protein [Niabella yanshanensis]|uniref:DUF72 domain-containing protein n=1 Tax=Niabella yanshanensis TaxID=577386 RepID=A0ABZ0W5K5_9BACT|nr:DUF72 domain-containing protein [Niabella yanshanensis]WQD38401.1 DUF72 domain-containing protein [Niabella yanshanensis]
MSAEKLYIGTSGIVLPYKNQLAYPEALKGLSRLSVYSTIFNSLEVNSIFYKLPRPATIAQWSESVGEAFRFTFKLWKQITHRPQLDFDKADLVKYFEVIAPAGEKAGCLLVQFPASVKCGFIKKLGALLSGIQQLNDGVWPVAVEFRSSCWYTDETYELLNQYNAAMVYHDKWGSESPQPNLDADHIYLRFHGPRGDYRDSYDPGLLYEYAEYVIDWMDAGKTVYIYFNNTMGDALNNAQVLRKFIKERI